MKKFIAVIAATATLVAFVALAGDDPRAQVAYTATQGCTAALRPKTKYAVQCTTDCYVRVQEVSTADAGMSVNTSSVKLLADKLYDTPTTSTQVYICAVRVSASGTMNVFIYRGPNE